MATVVGFSLYFYVLKHIEANRVALITLVTPVLALALGRVLNHEQMSSPMAMGAFLIVAALCMHQWADYLLIRYAGRSAAKVDWSDTTERQEDGR
jgi:drug/metabolite transporter (DMT)-like permease